MTKVTRGYDGTTDGRADGGMLGELTIVNISWKKTNEVEPEEDDVAAAGAENAVEMHEMETKQRSDSNSKCVTH